MSLWLINTALALLVLLFLLKPLVTRPVRTPEGRDHQDLLASRLAELEREHSVGLIGSDQHDQARRETEAFYSIPKDASTGEKATLAGASIAGIVALSIAGAAGFYFKYSDGHRLLALETQAQQMIDEIASVTEMLRNRLEENPEDTELRLRLAETYHLIGNYAGAVVEYRRVEALGMLQENDQWLNYADALLRSGETGQTNTMVKALGEMLNADPDNQRTLFTLSFLRFEREEYTQAIELWQRLLALLPADESGVDARLRLRDFIAEAENRLSAENGQGEATNGNTITVTVSLAPALRSAVAPNDTVFVYARAIGGPPMPVAIRRLTVAELPVQVTLGDSDAMMGNLTLGQLKQVEVVARVAKQGQAMPAKGDLIGTVSPVTVGGFAVVEIGELMD